MSAAFISLMFWGIPKMDKGLKYSAVTIAALSFFTMHWQFSFNVLIQWIAVNVGMLLLIQMTTFLEWKYVKPYLMITCLLQSVWFISNYLGFDPYEFYLKHGTDLKIMKMKTKSFTGNNIIGSLGNNTLSGALIAVTLPTLFRKKYLYLLPVPLTALYLSNSTMSLISAIFGLFIYFSISISYKKLMSTFSSVVLFGLALFVLDSPRNGFLGHSGRVPVWKAALGWNEGFQIIWGRGVGDVADNFKFFYKSKPAFEQLHNELLEFYVMYGLIGLVIVAYLFYRAITCKNKNAIVYGCMGSLCVNGLGSFPFHIAPTALLGIILYALIIKDQRRSTWH